MVRMENMEIMGSMEVMRGIRRERRSGFKVRENVRHRSKKIPREGVNLYRGGRGGCFMGLRKGRRKGGWGGYFLVLRVFEGDRLGAFMDFVDF